jgi:hypothetical protein
MSDLLAAAKMRDAANLDIVIPVKVYISSFPRKRESSVFFTNAVGSRFRGDDARFAAVAPA